MGGQVVNRKIGQVLTGSLLAFRVLLKVGVRVMRWGTPVMTLIVLCGATAGAASVAALPLEKDSRTGSCLHAAAHRHGVHEQLLSAVVHVESGGDPLAISVNQNGRGQRQLVRSVAEASGLVSRLWKQGANFDVGLGQINSVNMERFRIHPVFLLDPCTNLQIAARILREKIDQHGYNWTAIERYNGSNTRYPWKIYEALRRQMRDRK